MCRVQDQEPIAEFKAEAERFVAIPATLSECWCCPCYPHDPSELLIDCEEDPMLPGGLVGMPREAD